MISKIGMELHNKATRIGSYILVAYELKDLKEVKKDSDFFKYWILANRSSSFHGVKETEKDKFGFRKNLVKFYFRQIVTIVFFWFLANFMLVNAYIKSDQSSRFGRTDVLAVILFELLFVGCVRAILKDKKESEDYGREQIQRWQNYCNNRKKIDSYFLEEVCKQSEK